MKVAFILRPNLYTVPGGDTVQAEKTAAALRELGVEVEICLADEDINYNLYDLLHLFNVIDCEDLLGHVMRSKKPYVLSTIYVDYREYDRYHRHGPVRLLSRVLGYDQVEFMKTTMKWMFKGEPVSTYRYFLKRHKGSVKYLVQHCACLLPNSENEYHRLVNDYGVTQYYRVVPNGVDESLPSCEEEKRSLVLCAGRIEGRKNQLNLVKAMNGTGLSLVIIGAASPNQQAYYRLCRNEADKNIEFIDHVTQDKLFEYYCHARVHVLPSWFETTGLSSLEAGAMGCNLVIGDRGDVRDYFEEYADYCEPGSVESIRNAVLAAWDKPANPKLKKHICDNFTWKKAAEATLQAYTDVLN